jgi:hypothetical protein
MTTLHVFGCSITQGFALPDVINPIRDDQGRAYTPQEIQELGLTGIIGSESVVDVHQFLGRPEDCKADDEREYGDLDKLFPRI